MLTDTFKEINRITDKKGLTTIFYAHKTTQGWETFINSILNSNFWMSSSWPLHTEMNTRLIAWHKAALTSSYVLTCRKINDLEKVGYLDEVERELKEKLQEKLGQFWNSNIKGADFLFSAIGPSIEVYGKYGEVKKLSGEEVSVSEFLNLVREEVTNYALEKILSEGDVTGIDPETRFYILWRWAYDGVKVPFDNARILAQAIGAEIDDLMSKSGVLKKSGENVELLGPLEIKINKVESTIDVLHRSCQLWASGKKQELAEFLEENAKIKDELFWSTAQALSEVLPDGDKEKQLLQGLLASRSGISESIKQTRLL